MATSETMTADRARVTLSHVAIELRARFRLFVYFIRCFILYSYLCVMWRVCRNK